MYSLHSLATDPSFVILYKKTALIALALAGSAATLSLIAAKTASEFIEGILLLIVDSGLDCDLTTLCKSTNAPRNRNLINTNGFKVYGTITLQVLKIEIKEPEINAKRLLIRFTTARYFPRNYLKLTR